MARTTARPPRSKWPWIVGAAVVVGALVVGVTVFYNTRPVDQGMPTAAPTSTTAPTPGPGDAAPTGCLGGEARDAAMVIAAQKSAPHTSNGAVEFATSLIRWAYQYPYPIPGDLDQVGKAVISDAAPDSFRDLRAFFATNPNLSGGLVTDSTDYSLSTIPGVWYLESYSGDEAEISVGTGLVIEGVLSTTLRTSTTVSLLWENGTWRAKVLGGTRTTEEMYSIGTQFTEGC